MLDGIAAAADSLAAFVARHQRLMVLTGAGVSTGSGIPDYRDENGEWKQRSPIQYQDFVQSMLARQRYWARSALGWPRFSAAAPGQAHQALAQLEQRERLSMLVTQNVDRLHQRAGSRSVVDLHGRLDRVICLDCGEQSAREAVQDWLLDNNAVLESVTARPLADGDAWLEDFDFGTIRIPVCAACGGMLKPDVVFFGENVPAERVAQAFAALEQSDALLVVGSSLMVYSGFRFVRRAHEQGIPIAAINRGVTRADDLLTIKIATDCGEALMQALQQL